MSLVLELDVFSGRPNPMIELDGEEAWGVLERLHPRERLRPAPDLTSPSYLGYRGILISGADRYEQADLPDSLRLFRGEIVGPGVAHRPADSEAERFLMSAEGPFRELERWEELAEHVRVLPGVGVEWEWPWWLHYPWPWVNPCACGPLYEPTWWNVPARQPLNNCYNYATNYRTDTFAQPGRAAGSQYTSLACANVSQAALADDLIAAPDAENLCPAEGQLVALVVAPGYDFHWYRKGRDGLWTHKPGGTPVTNVDNAGHAIGDPRTADRGPYTDFCGFMIVMDGHIKIS